jgi:hypothetical protein
MGVVLFAVLPVAAYLSSADARAFELHFGIGAGGILAGANPRLAISPHASIAWNLDSEFAFSAGNMLSVIPPFRGPGGVYDATNASVGYAAKNAKFILGPSLTIYSISACGVRVCGPVIGIAPGGRAQVDYYLTGSLGVSVTAGVDWIGGSSLVLPGGAAAMVVAGPIFRVTSK